MNEGSKTCFVVMGFGDKPDVQPNPKRILNLDRTFQYIIEPAIKEAGLNCVRSDKIVQSGIIDKPMYEYLLNADVVVVDLSTSNPNAIYELGVRHALRPSTTIVMAESGFKFPFDLQNLSILRYQHSGKDLYVSVVDETKRKLTDQLRALAKTEAVDSPVYTFLPKLAPGKIVSSEPDATTDPDLAVLEDSFQKAKAASKWVVATAYLRQLCEKRPQDPQFLQQLAFAISKSEQPDKVAALQEAGTLLAQLSPATTDNAEIADLWGSVHQQLWEVNGDPSAIDEAVRAYERCFFLKDEYLYGINYAYSLDARASVSDGDDAVADHVFARRIRARVVLICESKLKAPNLTTREMFHVYAARAEALFGQTDKTRLESERSAMIASERERLRAAGLDSVDADARSQDLDARLHNLERLLTKQWRPVRADVPGSKRLRRRLKG